MGSLVHGMRSTIAWVSRTRAFRLVGPHIMPPLERVTAFVTGGRVQTSGLLVPSLILHTIGAKSGMPRDVPLMYCPAAAHGMLVTGSNFARANHPGWTANLIAHPDAAVTVRGRRRRVHARLITGGQRERAWQAIEKQWPGYRGYERASGRTLRIFLLQPTNDETDSSGA